MKNYDNKKWEQEYPKMPDSFHQALLQEVERQVNTDHEKITQIGSGTGKRRLRRPAMKIAVVAAAIALCGITVFAAANSRLMELLGWRLSAENTENLVQTDLEITQPDTTHISAGMAENMDIVNSWPALPDTSPLLDIQETLFDGIKLYIYAVPTDNGKNYDLNSDRLYINDVETGPVSTAHFYPGDTLWNGTAEQEMYTFEVDLSDLELDDTFEVTLPLSVYEKSEDRNYSITIEDMDTYVPPLRYQNQDLTFSVSANQTVMQCPEQSFTYDDFTLEITGITVSATMIKADFYYHMTPELLEDCQASRKIILPPAIFSEDGEECAFLNGSSVEKEDGILYSFEYSNGGISQEDDMCTVVTRIRDYSSNEEYKDVAESKVSLQ